MKVVQFEEVDWVSQDTQRGKLNLKTVLTGSEGTPENYWLILSKPEGIYESPRHCHNFDQIRIALDGKTNVDPKKSLEPGEIGYFPESVSYGPQRDVPGNVMLLLQFGGTSGSGFLSVSQMAAAQAAMRAFGDFKAGVFYRHSGEGRKNQDGFEAMWEHALGRKMVYPAARFDAPVFMTPESFNWRPMGAGSYRKTLGVFTERETRVEMIKLDRGGRLRLSPEQATVVNFVLAGQGSCSGQPYGRWTAVETAYGEDAVFEAEAATEIVRVVMPPVEMPDAVSDRRAAAQLTTA